MEPIIETLQSDGWVYRQRKPPGNGPFPVMLLIHGWTGDENSMWVFASRLPKNALLIAPRGLYPATSGGYGWHPDLEGWPETGNFRPAVDALIDLLTAQRFPDADISDLRVIGFSQGAALTYTLSLMHPERVRSLAGLAGFMPAGAEAMAQNQPLQNKYVFVAHGTLDEQVPVQRARQSVEILEQAGAEVTYCEEDVSHKLAAACFRGLEHFFAKY